MQLIPVASLTRFCVRLVFVTKDELPQDIHAYVYCNAPSFRSTCIGCSNQRNYIENTIHADDSCVNGMSQPALKRIFPVRVVFLQLLGF